MNDHQQVNQKDQSLSWQKYSLFVFFIFSLFVSIGVLIAHFLVNKDLELSDKSKLEVTIEKHSILDDQEENQTKESDSAKHNSLREEQLRQLSKPYQVEAQYSDGKEKFDAAFDKLKTIDQVQDPQQGIKLVDQAINELEQSRELMLSIAPQSPVYQEAKNYLNHAEQYSQTANAWKQVFIEKALLAKVKSEPNSQSFGASKVLTKRKLPELSIKQKSSFLTAMKPRSVALTFDDGPTREYTPKILEILHKHGARSTFFVVGKRVRENCDILRAIYQSGHEIGNHTDTHPYLTKISPNAQAQEIHNTQQSVNQCLGFEYPMNWFRAPYGDQNPDVLDLVRRFGLNSTQWIIDTHDWKKTSSVAEIRNTINNYNNPGVILMHDGSLTNPNFLHPNENPSRQNTVDALEPIIGDLKNRGFNFVPLSEAFR